MAPTVLVEVDPGICGFPCRIEATTIRKRVVRLTIADSECELVQRLDAELGDVEIKALFLPLCRNPVSIAADRAGCHSACPVPIALIKAAEVAMGMALPKTVKITIERLDGEAV